MSLKNNLISEFFIIIAILIIGYIVGWNEVVNLLHEDIGMIIAIIGFLWSFGALLKSNALSEAVISIVIGIGLTIFGITLHMFGLGYALLSTGIYGFFTNKFVRDVAEVGNIVISNSVLSICALISIGFIVIGYPIRNLTQPTNPQPESYPDIKNTNMVCRIDIDVYNKNNVSTSTRTIGFLKGSEDSIYKQAYKMPKKVQSFETIESINVVPTYIPPGCIPPGKEKWMGLSTKTLKTTGTSGYGSYYCTYFKDIENPWRY